MNRKIWMLVCVSFLSFSVSAQGFDWIKAKKLEFEQDTLNIEQEARDMQDRDYSTPGMMSAMRFREEGYDKLLNRYYGELMWLLNDENKKLLRDSQRNWIVLRDTDRKLIWGMKEQVYEEAGGGTIWNIVAANAVANVTRERVIMLYNYLMF